MAELDEEGLSARPRRPWLAGLMAAFTSGFGHLYVGRWRAAASIPIVVFGGSALAIILTLLAGGSSLTALIVGGLVWVGLHLLQVVGAVRIAQRAPVDFTPRRFNRGAVYVLWFLLVQATASLPAMAVRANVLELFKIPSDSMQPTLQPGDYLAIPKIGPYARTPLQVGDVAVFAYPPDPSVNYVKRIAGLPGDAVRVAHNRLEIEGKVHSARCNQPTATVTDRFGRDEAADCWLESRSDGVSWPIVVARARARSPGADYGPTLVGPGEALMFGDFRTDSSDSRIWGAVQIDRLLGRPDVIVFSVGRRDGLRWDRIGTPLQPQ